MSPQAQSVLSLIRRDGYVTRMTATHYGVACITARISEIRRYGYDVKCQNKLDARGKRYGRWYLTQPLVSKQALVPVTPPVPRSDIPAGCKLTGRFTHSLAFN